MSTARIERDRHVQLFFWDLTIPLGLEDAIHADVRRLRSEFPEIRAWRVALHSVTLAGTEPPAQGVRLELAETAALEGWRMIIEGRHARVEGAVKAAFSEARHVLSARRRRSGSLPHRGG